MAPALPLTDVMLTEPEGVIAWLVAVVAWLVAVVLLTVVETDPSSNLGH